jgi:hypothetical protein
MSCATLFPDYDDQLPTIDGFADSSYGNDTCPSIHNETLGLTIHCDYADNTKREIGGCSRYGISNTDGQWLFDCDDIDAVLAFIADYDEMHGKCRNGKPINKCTCC